MLTWFTILCWAPVFLVSLNHIFKFSYLLVLPTALCGALFFLAITSTLVYLTRNYIAEAFFIVLLFFCIGWVSGPFLEPHGDPNDHLAKAYSTCGSSSKNIYTVNGGLWHYSMNGVILCSEDPWSQPPQQVLLKIRFLHSTMLAILAVGLFALGKSAGMSPFWAGFGVLVTFLFMGTNRFSYFGYYSLADSSSSLLIYWMWIAAFFFKLRQTHRHTLIAFVSALILIPILYVNHVQEAIFLGLICGIYLLIQFLQFAYSIDNKKLHWTIIGALVLLFFVCPQIEVFRNTIAPFFMINDWEKNQNLVVFLGPIHLMGKIWSYRVNDTLGLMGILALPAAIAVIWMAKKEMISYKVAIVGVLPLLVYCVPLLHYIWLSNCRWLPTHTRYYYRICYASLFGVTFAYLFYQVEQRLYFIKGTVLPRLKREVIAQKLIPFFKILCLTVFILISTIRSGPVYGKMDFLTLDTNPWWPQWRPMLEELTKQNSGKPVYTDVVTGFVLNSVFNYPILEKGPRPSKGRVDLDSLPSSNKYYVLVNLKGFLPSWVPTETHHWRSRIGNTARLYSYKGKRGSKIKKVITRHPIPNVQIFD